MRVFDDRSLPGSVRFSRGGFRTAGLTARRGQTIGDVSDEFPAQQLVQPVHQEPVKTDHFPSPRLPVHFHGQAALRDAEIYRRAHRGNILTLASEYGLTERHIWRICRQQRKLHLEKIQGRLFEDMEGE